MKISDLRGLLMYADGSKEASFEANGELYVVDSVNIANDTHRIHLKPAIDETKAN